LAILVIGFSVFFSSIVPMKQSLVLLALPAILLVSCTSPEPKFEVTVYKLKDTQVADRDAPVVRAEQQKRLRGAVSEEEREQRLGGYYTVDWDAGERFDPSLATKVVFLYRQAGTASKVLRKEQIYSAGKRKGVTEFSIVGEDFRQNGRVLNWRSELYSGTELIAYEQSYLWQ
jgi:hypothetical protein